MPRYSFLILILLFIPGFVWATPQITGSMNVDGLNVEGYANITYYGGDVANVEVDFGDGNTESYSCDISPSKPSCTVVFRYVYDHNGDYPVDVGAGPSGDHTWHRIGTANISVDHCSNGVQDQDEEGVDCGGRECTPCSQPSPNQYDNPILADNAVEFIWQLVYFFFSVVFYLSILFILIGAYILVTARGDVNKIRLAKKIIIFTLIGFAISYAGRAILVFTVTVLGD